MGWLDVLIGGVGTGIGGVGQAVAGAREKRLEAERHAEDRKLREADLAERRRQFDEGRFTPVETILPFLPEAVRVRMQAAAPGGKVPTAIVPSFLQDLREQAKQAREAEQVRGLSETLEGQATTMPSPERAEMEPASVDPRMLSLARMVRNLPLGEASKIVAEQVKPRNPMLVSDTTAGVLDPGTGKITPVPQAPAQPFTPPAGYQESSTAVGKRGQVTGRTFKPIEARDDFDRAAYTVTNGLKQRFEDLDPNERKAANDYVKNFRGDIAARQGEGTAEGRGRAAMDQPISREDASAMGMPFGVTMREAIAAKRVPLNAAQQTRAAALQGSVAIVDKMEQDVRKLFTAGGLFDRIAQIPQQSRDVYLQGNPEATVFESTKEGVLAMFVRAFGDVGTLNEGDIKRARALLPRLVPVPDTRDVALGKLQRLRELFQEIAMRSAQPGAAPLPQQGEKELIQPTHTPTHRWNPTTGRLEKIR